MLKARKWIQLFELRLRPARFSIASRTPVGQMVAFGGVDGWTD